MQKRCVPQGQDCPEVVRLLKELDRRGYSVQLLGGAAVFPHVPAEVQPILDTLRAHYDELVEQLRRQKTHNLRA